MITDNDIKKLKQVFTTKDDLKAYATKDDLKSFATKDDLKAYATKNDLDNALEKQTQKIESMLFDFRSDILSHVDQAISTIARVEEDQVVTSHQLTDHEDRLEVIETNLHIAAV